MKAEQCCLKDYILFDYMEYPVFHFHFNKILLQYSLVSGFYDFGD